MKISVSVFLAFFLGMSIANADVLTFESPVIGSCFIWGTSPDGWTIEDSTASVSNHAACISDNYLMNTDGAYEGAQTLMNFNSRVGTLIRDAGEFYFNGAYFHADERAGNTLVEFAGYDISDTLIFSEQVEISTEWQWVSFDWAGISKFTWDSISPESSSNVTIDNFTYDGEISEEYVPVPTMTTYGVALTIMALLLTAGYRLRTSTRQM